MKIKTPSDLKYWHEQLNPASYFFTRETMRYFGDTMRNYSVRQPREITTPSGDKVLAYELSRCRPVKYGYSSSAWFEVGTLRRCFPKIGT